MTCDDRGLKSGQLAALKSLADTFYKVGDLDVMMETILTEARRMVGAEAGSIYIREGYRLVFSYSQNDFLSVGENGGGSAYKDQQIPLTGNSLAGFVGREGVLLNIEDAYKISPEMLYRFDSDFDRRTGYISRSVLTLPLKDIKGDTLGVLQVINRLDQEGRPRAFDQDDENLMSFFSSQASMALERAQLNRQMLLRSVKMAELRDPRETTLHVQRVAAMAVMLYEIWAAKRSLPKAEIRRNADHLSMAAMLHDIGKVGVPDTVLNKPGRLDPAERLEMQRHVVIGLKLFEPAFSDLDLMIRDVILNHHERWDGRGYPGWINLDTGLPLPGRHGPDSSPVGKKGEEISIFGRVTAVADVFDALSFRRVYKDAFDEDLVCQIMMQESGHHFDPELVDDLLLNLDQAKFIRRRFPE